nr:uncharacterized protein LOC104095305 [Nicotiana tomentosiformis]
MASLTFLKLIPERKRNQTLTANAHLKKINPLIHFPHFFPKISLHNHNSHFQLCFSQRSHTAHDFFDNTYSFVTKGFFLLTFSFTLVSLRIISTILVPEFPQRWTRLIAFSKRAELELMCSCPQHLIQAVVAYEDRRFFHHFGVDPVGVARAVLSLSSLGGGSTITQQAIMPDRRCKCYILHPQLLLSPNVTHISTWSPIIIKLV